MAPSITAENGEFASSALAQDSKHASHHLNGQTTKCSNGYVTGEAISDAIDMEQVRSQFPALSGETVLFNNASGTVILRDAVTA